MGEHTPTFEEWMAQQGQEHFNEAMDWLSEAPEGMKHILNMNKVDHIAMAICEGTYEETYNG